MKRILLLGFALLSILCFIQSCDTQGCGPGETNPPPIPSQTVDPSASPLVTDGYYFRDAQGAIVILRGLNVAGNSKVPPFQGVTSAAELQPLPALGVNTIRLLFTWEAYEPVEGEYSADYMTYYQQVVQWADQLGLYVIVDFHQDAYSRYLLNGCGEGFPSWAVTPEVKQATPDNDASCSAWGVQMLINPGLATAWNHFHSDTYGAKSAYLAMAANVAQHMAAHDNVIGYELINEPWGTDEQLATFFEQVGQSIRQNDPRAILFVPAHALVTGGTKKNTMNRPSFTNMAYSPHYYNGSVLLLKNWGGLSPARQLDTLRTTAESWQVPMFLGEFGAPAGTHAGLEYIQAQLDWLDTHWISSTQWNYTPGWREDVKDGWNTEDLSIVDDQGNLRDNFTARPYPQKIAGAPKSFQLDDTGFILTWTNRPGYGTTKVFVPQGYTDNRDLTVELPRSASGSCEVQEYAVICNIEGGGDTRVSLTQQ